MRSAAAFVGLGALALVVGQADYSIAAAAAREHRVAYVRFSGPRPVPSVAACARRAGLPPPAPCKAAPCGWVVNTSAYSAEGWPLWITRCQVPLR
jgi:hypothetical protein